MIPYFRCCGSLHSIVNPAGILRDKMFHKMDDQDWDAVIDVHLNGIIIFVELLLIILEIKKKEILYYLHQLLD